MKYLVRIKTDYLDIDFLTIRWIDNNFHQCLKMNGVWYLLWKENELKFREKTKMFSYALFTNIVSSFVTLLATFFIPKYFGNHIFDYGMQQIFVFYTGYIGFFHFGLCDGLYLRDGGKTYNELSKPIYSREFRVLVIITLIEAAVIMIGSRLLGGIGEYSFIVVMVSANIIIQIQYTYFSYILQATGKIKYYAISQIVGSIAYIILLIILFVSKVVNYKLVILAYTVSQLIILCMYLYRCRDIVSSKPCDVKTGINEAWTNIKIGSQLLIANIAANLITGVVRFGIQMNWDVAIYGQISLTISISNILLLFVSAISMVLYPILRREGSQNYSGIYSKLRGFLMILLFGGMVFYYPIMKIAGYWLPQYMEGLKYMALLFPICCYSAKMSMLVLTYMKVMRLEKKILSVNLISVFISFVTTVVSCYLLKNLTLAMISIVFNQMIRCIIAELMLSKYIKYNPIRDIVIEAIMTCIFILCSWFVGGLTGVGLYVISYFAYLIIYKKNVKEIKPLIKGALK